MNLTLPLDEMTLEDKLRLMEVLWADLSRHEDELESPAWHAQALRETERRVAAGEEQPMDWEAAKEEFRKRRE